MKNEPQEGFLTNITEFFHHPFYVVNVDDYTIRMANSAARLCGLTENSTCYLMHGRRATPCGGTENPCPLEMVKKTGKPATVEHIHYDADGHARNVEVHAHPVFDGSGEVVQVIEYCVDITERRQLEKMVRR